MEEARLLLRVSSSFIGRTSWSRTGLKAGTADNLPMAGESLFDKALCSGANGALMSSGALGGELTVLSVATISY